MTETSPTAPGAPMNLNPVGMVLSPHQDRHALPHQGRGRDIQAVIKIFPQYEAAAREIQPGGLIWVLSWMHQAERTVLQVHPQGDQTRPLTGVFSTRSPARPNPIGLSLVEVVERTGNEITVRGLEVVDGTPILDIKPHSPGIDS